MSPRFAHRSPDLCPEALDGDGTIGITDRLVLPADWG
jgi:hypothetical protein